MAEKLAWLEQILRLAQTDRSAAQECLQSVTANRLVRSLLALSAPEQLIAPMILMIVSPEQFTAIESVMARVQPSIEKQLQSARRHLFAQELAVKQAFQTALDAQTSHSKEEESARELYFLQIGIREMRKARVLYVLSRKESALRIADAIATESLRRNAAH